MAENASDQVMDLTSESSPTKQVSNIITQSCPICGLELPENELPAHCDAHFAADEEELPIGIFEQDVGISTAAADDCVCPLCGLDIQSEDAESHALAHSLECEDLDPQSTSNDLYFEELRAKYGFVPKQRPGSCFTCGQAGHWTPDCPKNPTNVVAKARIISKPSAEAVAAAQRPDPQYQRPACDPATLLRLLGEGAVKQRLPREFSRCTTILSGPVVHFGGQRADAGWGCGYRNIQMQASHFLAAAQTSGQSALVSSLFGGAGVVPDVPSLQAWIEVAWGAGFDLAGAEQLGNSLQGGKKWIGTSEAAALFRYFGIPSEIIDFGVSPELKHDTNSNKRPRTDPLNNNISSGGALVTSNHGANSARTPGGNHSISGNPAVQYQSSSGTAIHVGVECDRCGAFPLTGDRYCSQVLPDYDLCSTCHALDSSTAGPFLLIPPPQATGQSPQFLGRGNSNGSGSHIYNNTGGNKGQQCSPAGKALLDWVWTYFNTQPQAQQSTTNLLGTAPKLGLCSSSTAPESSAAAPAERALLSRSGPGWKLEVRYTGRPPLYLQHEGHSRTIMGIEKRERRSGGDPELTLLLLDPGVPPPALTDALRDGVKWQRLMKRGAHTLRQSQFQVLYCPEGAVHVVPGTAEYERLKILKAQERY